MNWPGNITGSDKNVTNNNNVDEELLVDKITQVLLSIIRTPWGVEGLTKNTAVRDPRDSAVQIN